MYTINNTRGTILTTINDGVVDSTTTVSLPGRQYQNYGELVNENFIKLLENSGVFNFTFAKEKFKASELI